MRKTDKKYPGRNNWQLIAILAVPLGYAVLTTAILWSANDLHERVDMLEAYINDVEVYRSQDRDELDRMREDLRRSGEHSNEIFCSLKPSLCNLFSDYASCYGPPEN